MARRSFMATGVSLPFAPIYGYSLKLHKYVHVTTYQPYTKSNFNFNPNPTTKHHAVVNIQLNIVACRTYPDKFIRDSVDASSVRLSIVRCQSAAYLQFSWTSSLQVSADGPQTAALVIQPFQTVTRRSFCVVNVNSV